MSDFQMVRGFEDVWRPPVRPRRVTPQAVLRSGADVRARLARVVNRVPEVMVKVTGRTGDPAHLRAHLDYISRNGQLELMTPDGGGIVGRAEVRDLAIGWAAEQLADRRTRAGAPFSHNLVLSMPAGTDPIAVRDAARAFAVDMFTGRHDYVYTLHTDTPRPHVHLSVCTRGYAGERLNPRKDDLELWRQVFAEKLRERGVAAEATPRRARGVTRKAERGSIRRMRERHEAGRGDMAATRRSAHQDAAKAAFRADTAPRVWEQRSLDRQALIRKTYLAQAKLLSFSADPVDRALGVEVETFVGAMPQPDSQRLALARELRTAALGAKQNRDAKAQDRER